MSKTKSWIKLNFLFQCKIALCYQIRKEKERLLRREDSDTDTADEDFLCDIDSVISEIGI